MLRSHTGGISSKETSETFHVIPQTEEFLSQTALCSVINSEESGGFWEKSSETGRSSCDINPAAASGSAVARRADAADLESVMPLTRTGRPPPGRPRRSHLRPSGSRRLPAPPDPGPPGSAVSRNTPPGGKHTDRAFTGVWTADGPELPNENVFK